MTQQSLFYLPEKLENSYLQRYVQPYIHCSTIHGGQDMETTKVAFSRGLGKDVVHMDTMDTAQP